MRDIELDEYLIAMNRAFRTLTAGPDGILDDSGLGRAHHRALFVIRRETGISIGRLATLLDVTNQALHKTLGPLLKQKLVRAEPSPEDARGKCLFLTQTGVRLEERISGMQHEVFRLVARDSGQQAMREWLAIMERIVERSGKS